MIVRKRWTREELLIAINLYHKLTFGQMHGRQPAIIAVAKKVDRTADSLAMKLSNFASLDPALKLRGIRGLSGASALDRTVWHEFHADPSEAVPASEEAFRKLFVSDEESAVEVTPSAGVVIERAPPVGPTEGISLVKTRRGQDYFRQAVLNNFAGKCGVTELNIRELLIASHIVPWRTHPAERLNVRNGLSLSRIHDAAFDVGLITFDTELCLRLSPALKACASQRMVAESFVAYEGAQLKLGTDAVLPNEKFLTEHRANIFRKA